MSRNDAQQAARNLNYDRTVHACFRDAAGELGPADLAYEIVRYDRASKWYAEPAGDGKRKPLSIREAARLATLPGAVRFDAYGGQVFRKHVRAILEHARPQGKG